MFNEDKAKLKYIISNMYKSISSILNNKFRTNDKKVVACVTLSSIPHASLILLLRSIFAPYLHYTSILDGCGGSDCAK